MMEHTQSQKINQTTTVAELLSAWPQVIPIFLRHRMACVGCSMSGFETLADAAKIYGLIPDEFLGELREIIHSHD